MLALCAGLAVTQVSGVEFFSNYTWANPSGGSYTNSANWTGSSGVPDSSNENAIFDLDFTHTVGFPANVSTASASVADGHVTWDLDANGTAHSYTLNSLVVDPAGLGGDPRLTITDGMVRAAQLRVQNGGQLFVTSRADLSGDATFAVTGSGSAWTDDEDTFVVGQQDVGELTLSAGAVVSSQTGYIGEGLGSNGTATVTGAGSTWTNPSWFYVGYSGTGTLAIADGGRLETGPSAIGFDPGAVGAVTVTGPGSTWINNGLSVGDAGTGTLLIDHGGNVSNFGSIIAAREGDGTMTVDGAGSTFSSQLYLEIGSDGNGRLEIQNGGTVSSGPGFVGSYTATAFGVVSVGADARWIISGQLSIGGNANTGTNGGTGSLVLLPDAAVSATEDIVLFPTGRVVMLGGTLIAPEVHFQGGGTFEWDSGTLHVVIFDDDLTNGGGTLAPGHSVPGGAPGSTTITGEYVQKADAVLDIEIGGRAAGTRFDFVDVKGSAQLGGELHVTLIDGFIPDPTDQFIILHSGNLINFFSNVGSGQRLTTLDGIGSFVVNYGPTSSLDPDQVIFTDFAFEENPPVIREQVANQTATAGSKVTLSIDAVGRDPVTYQWRKDGVDIPGATDATYVLPSVQAFHAGDYTVVVTNPFGEVTSDAATLTIDPAAPSNARLLNLSTRGLAEAGANQLFPGFVISGTGTKKLLIRAIGPSLADLGFGDPVIPDPQLALKKFNFTTGQYEDLQSNDDWGTNANATDITTTAAQVSAFPITDAQDAALLVDLAPGQYAVIGGDKDGTAGIGIVELYDADVGSPTTRLVNISNRGFCGVGSQVMIPGFVVSSEGPKTFLVRVVGPRLGDFNVPGTMADPKLALYKHDFVGNKDDLLLTQDNWSDSPDAANTAQTASDVGAFALADGSKDASSVVTLEPGVYTVVGSAADGTSTGVVLVEVYVVP